MNSPVHLSILNVNLSCYFINQYESCQSWRNAAQSEIANVNTNPVSADTNACHSFYEPGAQVVSMYMQTGTIIGSISITQVKEAALVIYRRYEIMQSIENMCT